MQSVVNTGYFYVLTEFFYVCGCIRKWSNEIRGEFVNYSVSNPYMYVSIVCALITYCVFSEWIIHTYMVQLNTLPYGGKFWRTLDFWKFFGILCWHTYLSIYSIDSAVLPKVYLSICIYVYEQCAAIQYDWHQLNVMLTQVFQHLRVWFQWFIGHLGVSACHCVDNVLFNCSHV